MRPRDLLVLIGALTLCPACGAPARSPTPPSVAPVAASPTTAHRGPAEPSPTSVGPSLPAAPAAPAAPVAPTAPAASSDGASVVARSEADAPSPVEGEPYVEAGLCPGECCTYGAWTATRDVDVLDRPGGVPVAHLAPEEPVTAETGEVHVVPVAARVVADHALDPVGEGPSATARKGDVVWLLAPIGEGLAHVWWGGRLYEADVYLATDAACRAGTATNPDCWATAPLGSEPFVHRWWVRVRTKDGAVGWVDNSDDVLTGFDRC